MRERIAASTGLSSSHSALAAAAREGVVPLSDGREDHVLHRARAWVREVVSREGENFVVLGRMTAAHLRDDYAALYAFCRLADDLADQSPPDFDAESRVAPSLMLPDMTQTRRKALAELREFRLRLRRALSGQPKEPLFVALADTIARRRLRAQLFEDLLDAFELDQRLVRYEHWEELLAYSRRSANPVGRLLLGLHGIDLHHEASDVPFAPGQRADIARCSDALCTALQLTNFWQDVRRDLLERDRVYLPSKDTGISPDELASWLARPNEPSVRRRYVAEVELLCRRTWQLFDQARPLAAMLAPHDRRLAWQVWLYQRGGEETLVAIEREGYTTLWRRPSLDGVDKALLGLRAVLGWVGGRSPGVRQATG